jgi:two-component system, OmpR family, copper resistance phosphate regulon response regulator CusR
MRILVVEDETSIANFIRDGLEEEGFAVDVALTGKTGLELALTNDYDVLLLDWMLPGISGVEICSNVRRRDNNIPIIFLTAKDTAQDAVMGLECGADDYIKKPFEFDELLARIRARLRPKDGTPSKLGFGDIMMDLSAHRVFHGEKEIALTPKEFSLLEYLIRNKGKVCTRTNIIEHVWDLHFDADTSVIDVYMNYLRKKLNDNGELIQTVRGVGYIIREET